MRTLGYKDFAFSISSAFIADTNSSVPFKN